MLARHDPDDVRTTRASGRRELIRQMAEGIAAAHGATAEVETVERLPGHDQRRRPSRRWSSTPRRELFGEERVDEMPCAVMGAEDFSYVLQRVPGVEVFLGARPAGLDPATVPQNHSNRVVLDESAMATGVALYAAMAERLLERAESEPPGTGSRGAIHRPSMQRPIRRDTMPP